MKRIVLSAGLACALALPGIAAAQAGHGGTAAGGHGAAAGAGSAAQGSTAGQGGTAAAKPAKPSPGTPAGSTAQAGAGAVAAADKAFVTKAAQGSMAEVEMGKLAADKAESADVKQFGRRMADDHGKASDELKSWASKNDVTLPSAPAAKHKAEHDRLAKLSGAAFDRAYMAMMVADHNKDVAEFQRAAKTTKNAELKAWVEKTLPTLQEHQKMAREVSAKVRGTSAKGAASTGASEGGSGKSAPKAGDPGARPHVPPSKPAGPAETPRTPGAK